MKLPDFLFQQSIFESANYAGLDLAKTEQLAELAKQIAGSETLRSAAEKLHTETYDPTQQTEQSFPSVAFQEATIFGDEINKLYLLLALDAVRQLRATHTQRGIPESVTRITATALANAARRFGEWSGGKLGVEDWVLRYWFNVVGSGDLYRLGRMEFIWEPFEPAIRVYQNRTTGAVQALAEDGVNFASDGYNPFVFRPENAARYGWSTDQGEIWTASLKQSESSVTGTPISPLGYAIREEITLPLADWDLIFRHGDPVLEMHIPNFAPLTLDLLKDSFERARDFFPRYHPERTFKAFSCNSWLFNTQWVEMLPSDSNVLGFQRQGYLFPIPSDGLEGMYFLFGNWQVDLDNAPQNTTLRRAVINHLKKGGKLRTGGFFLLPEDVAKFGNEPYRKNEIG